MLNYFFGVKLNFLTGTIKMQTGLWVGVEYPDEPDYEAATDLVLAEIVNNRTVPIMAGVWASSVLKTVTCQMYSAGFAPILPMPTTLEVSVNGGLPGSLAGPMGTYNIAYALSVGERFTAYNHPPLTQSHTPMGPLPEVLISNDGIVDYAGFPGGVLDGVKTALRVGWTSIDLHDYKMIRVGTTKFIGGAPDPDKARSWASIVSVVARPEASFLRSRAR